MLKIVQKQNQDIRNLIKQSPVYTYNVANELGYSANYFLVLLRQPLSKKQKQEIKAAIKSATAKAKAEAKATAGA